MLDISQYQVGKVVKGKASLKEAKTTPPKPFVEGDLVAIMDDIGRYAEIGREQMAILRERNSSGSGKAGIGTARTRGEIIKKLFDAGFIEKTRGQIVQPTEKGLSLYEKLHQCGVAKVLTSPEMTAKWEEGLKKIEEGAVTVEQFMHQLEQFVQQMVADMMANPSITKVTPHPLEGQICPKCEKGKLVTRTVTNQKSRFFGQRYVRCGECDYFGEFVA